MTPLHWTQRWSAIRAACQRRRATDRWLKGRTRPPKFEIDPPASESEIVAIERGLGFPLPASFRRVLTTYSRAVDIGWQLPEDAEPPFAGIFAGECRWSLAGLPALVREHREWIDVCFKDPEDRYDREWHGKLPVLSVGNGDMVAIDLADEAVVYLSHDDGEGHGYRLGADFEDYLDRLSRLGCVGAEDWQWLPFVDGPGSFLLPHGQNAVLWRQWFGLELPTA
jgi:hypothetical protein